MPNLSFDPDSHSRDEAFERRLDRALATAPSTHIPQEFAARVAALVPASRPIPAPTFAYARTSMILSVIALFVALLFLAPHLTPGSIYSIALEWTLCAELSLLALYVALTRRTLRSAG